MTKSAVAEPDQAVAEQTVEQPAEKTRKDQCPKRQPRYHVILWNDDEHSYDYVIHMLRDLFGHPYDTGYQLAREVDKAGRTVCLTTTLEHAELKRDQIHAYGRDPLIPRCKGSMSASIEPDR